MCMFSVKLQKLPIDIVDVFDGLTEQSPIIIVIIIIIIIMVLIQWNPYRYFIFIITL